MGPDRPIPRRHVSQGSRLGRHMTVLADPGLVGEIERASGIAGDPAVVPAVVLVLTPEPPVVVDGSVQGHLVAGRAVLPGFKERLEERGLVGGGTGPQRRIVKDVTR